MSLFVCSTLCYAQEDDPFGLYEKGASRTKKYDLEKEYKVKEKSLAPFVGLNLGIGGNFGRGFKTLEGSLGIDVAGSINDRFAMGCYFSYQTITVVSFGLLFVHGNHNESHAFLWGIGYSSPEFALRSKDHKWEIGYDYYYYYDYDVANIKITPNFRFGFMLKNGLYFMTDMEVSSNYVSYKSNKMPYNNYHYDDNNNHYHRYSFDINFRIGYKFNSTKKKNKK